MGTVGKAHGLQGAFFIADRDGPIPSGIMRVFLGNQAASAAPRNIRKQLLAGGRAVLFCEAMSSREELEPIQGQAIWVKREDLAIDSDKHYLWADLIDKELVDHSGSVVGRIVRVANHGATDFAEVVDAAGRTLGVPLVRTYINMDFNPDDTEIRLVVAKDVFDDAWEG